LKIKSEKPEELGGLRDNIGVIWDKHGGVWDKLGGISDNFGVSKMPPNQRFSFKIKENDRFRS
jgi:hypothetical protein